MYTLWFTGMSGAGKTTLSRIIYNRLSALGRDTKLLDGDVLRKSLCKDLGFSKEDRDENVKRIIEACSLFNDSDIISIVAVISPYIKARAQAREEILRFIEVYCMCPLNVLIDRDSKGMYKKAIEGEIENFTGISDIYEPPDDPELVLNTNELSINHCADAIWGYLLGRGFI